MAQHLIGIAINDPAKKHEYGIPIALDEFHDLHMELLYPAATAARLKALPADGTDPARITAIYEPEDGFKDSDILNIEMLLDIFGLSTMEAVAINTPHPTLVFEFHLPQRAAMPIIKVCKSGTQAAKLKNW